MVGTECEEKDLSPDTWGVGRCDHSPGIIDAPYGKVLIAPGHYVSKYFKKVRSVRSITEVQLRNCIITFYNR